MKVVERDLNVYEQLQEAIDKAKAIGKRVSEVYMSEAEFAELYNEATLYLVYNALQDLANKHKFFDIQIIIEEPKRKK